MSISSIYNWVATHIPVWVYITLVIHLVVLGGVAYMILLERKVASWVQDRIGPNRVGLGFGILPVIRNWHMFGLGQPLADGLKFIVKEDYQAKGVDAILFTLAPIVMIITVIISIAVIPWGGVKQATRSYDVTTAVQKGADPKDAAIASLPIGYDPVPAGPVDESVAPSRLASAEAARVRNNITVQTAPPAAPGQPQQVVANVTYQYPFQIARLNIGALYILATLSLAVYGVVIGGWASNNKYSFLGGLRATANMISYEIPLGLAVLCIVLMNGSLDLGTIVDRQAHTWLGFIPAWNIFTQPLAFLMFLICIHAEANRAPFDLAEAEQELVGGYHTEYSSMRFALFFLAEYAGMVTTSAMLVALFWGGWHLWGLTSGADPMRPEVTTSLGVCILRTFVFLAKTLVVIFIFMWTRWSLPRFRFDQLMMLAWRALIPLSLAMLMMTATVLYLFRDEAQPNFWVSGKMALVYLAANIILLALTLGVSKLLPAPPETNRKLVIPGSRFRRTPLPAAAVN